jgi:hypothetical protein
VVSLRGHITYKGKIMTSPSAQPDGQACDDLRTTDAETIVMSAIREFDVEPNDVEKSPTPPIATMPALRTPDVTALTSTLIRWIADLAEQVGQPLSVDVSTLLREATVSLPSRECLRSWSSRLSTVDHDHVTTDQLGRFVAATFGDPLNGSWKVRLVWHGRRW